MIALRLLRWFLLPLILGGALAQDSAIVDPAHHKVVFENQWVRAILYDVPSHAATVRHSHPDSVSIELPDGATEWYPATTHNPVNDSDNGWHGIKVELKDYSVDSPNKDQVRRPEKDPILAAPAEHRLIFANKRIRVMRFHLSAHTKAPEHQHLATVVITLPGGEVSWFAPTIHSPENTSDKAADGLLVELLEGAKESSPKSPPQ